MQHLGEEEEGIKLPRVPHHSLTHDGAKEGGQHDLQIAPLAESFGQGRLGAGAFFLHLGENRRFMQFQTQIQTYAQEQTRQQVRNPPAPILERRLANARIGIAHQNHDPQRHGQAKGRGDLDPTGVKPALILWRVLGNIGGRAAIFAAQGKALNHAHGHQQNRRPNACRFIRRQQTNRKSRKPHHHQRDDESITTAEQIADAAKHQRAKRTHDKARRENQQRHDHAGGGVQPGQELRGEDTRHQTVKVKIVPFKHRTQRRGQNDLRLALGNLMVFGHTLT